MTGESLASVPVEDLEDLARFIFTKRHLRESGTETTVRAEAFAPFKRREMSVFRHLGLTEQELWSLGASAAQQRELAEQRPFPLVGRADFQAAHARQQKLDVVPLASPRNHADVVGWRPAKPAQMIIALELAGSSQYVPGGHEI